MLNLDVPDYLFSLKQDIFAKGATLYNYMINWGKRRRRYIYNTYFQPDGLTGN